MQLRALLSTALASSASVGCGMIAGVSDLEKVDCVEDCGSGGAGGGGGGAGGGAGASGIPATISVGRNTSCAILDTGTLYCWGANPGIEPGTLVTTPVRVAGIGEVKQLSIGAEHKCVVDTTGTVWCWGRNDSGQLGNGSFDPSAVPVPVPGLSSIDTVSSGETHTCAYTTPEMPPVDAFCWGNNDNGQLGDGTTNGSPTPIKLEFTDGANVFRLGPGAGYTSAVVVDPTGKFEVRCWGRNDKAQCGIDPATSPVVDVPTAVPGLPEMERVYPSAEHMCTRTQSTRIPWCWGANDRGQAGNGSPSPFSLPAAVVGVPAIVTMTPGLRHTCMSVRGDDTSFCWGANDLGQTNGVPGPDRPVPEIEPFLEGTSYLMRQALHGCGIRGAKVLCWGANDNGQVGNGETAPTSPAFELSFPP